MIRTRPGFHPPALVDVDRAEAACRAGQPDLAAVVLAAGQEQRTLAALRRVRAAGTGHVLLVGPATDPKLILRGMQAGADLFLDAADLGPELDAALTRLTARRGEPAGPGRLIAVLSAAGGCGASTVAVNLAAVIARARGRCNLIDLNPWKTDLAALLDLKPTYTLSDLCRNEDRLDRTLYEKLLTPHPSGVDLLAAPRQFEDVEALSPGAVAAAVRLARDVFADVVVDLEDCFHKEQVAVLDQATTVFLVCRLDFTAVRNTRRVLDHLAARGIPRDRVEVVVNAAGQANELPVAEAEVALGVTLTRFIPHDPATIGWANNTGVPAAVKEPGSAVVQGIARLVGLETPPPARPPLLDRVRGWAREASAAAARVCGPPARAVTARVRAVWTRARSPRTPPQPPDATDSTQDTKTNHEPLPDTRVAAADARSCPA
ncbi:MAG TPA: hypothetical protein VD866_21645 [Urbifossiella sp.]|nr:hypothetical protein [Urbifossiella sp.]